MAKRNYRGIVVLAAMVVLGGCGVREGVNLSREEVVGGELNEKYRDIWVGGRELRVEVADEPAEITKGLGYRDEIGADGMLFVFRRPYVPAFWMKGMRFGLDMVWIKCEDVATSDKEQAASFEGNKEEREECVVVDVTEKIPAPEDPENPVGSYSPLKEVTHVLEVEYGRTEEWGVEVGDVVVVD